jgi:hypothetical protein
MPHSPEDRRAAIVLALSSENNHDDLPLTVLQVRPGRHVLKCIADERNCTIYSITPGSEVDDISSTAAGESDQAKHLRLHLDRVVRDVPERLNSRERRCAKVSKTFVAAVDGVQRRRAQPRNRGDQERGSEDSLDLDRQVPKELKHDTGSPKPADFVRILLRVL